MSTTTITLPLTDAIEAFTAILPHVSKDDVTPVITHSAITQSAEGSAVLLGTDRYSVARFELGSRFTGDGDDAHSGDALFLVQQAAMLWITKIAPGGLRRKLMLAAYQLRITDQESEMGRETEVAIMFQDKVERSQVFDRGSNLNYPSVNRLIADGAVETERGNIALDPKRLERFTGYAAKFNHTMRISNTESYSKTKPGLMRIEIGDSFVGLLQPNLILDPRK